MPTANSLNIQDPGIVTFNGTNQFFGRTLTAGTGISITNGNGVAGDPIISASGGVTLVSGHLTSQQVKALHATPIAIVAAPGANRVLVPISIAIGIKYGGTSAFTAGASQSVGLYWSTTTTTGIAVATAALTGTATQFLTGMPAGISFGTLATYSNVPFNLYNPVLTEISGNAANDNTIQYALTYYVYDLTV